MKILLNEKIVEDAQASCGTTALEYLRETRHLTGTKEGCASGDCGACTIMVGEYSGDEIHYSTVNACITPIAALHNKHVVTVEHLKVNDQFHPAQSAMVKCHGSQCGFCTPGFVMSLASLYENSPEKLAISREEVCESISGNLCRCTGYRPIVDAGLSMGNEVTSAPLAGSAKTMMDEMVSMPSSPDDAYFSPETIVDYVELIKHYPEARIIAGGTDLMLEYTQRFADFPALIDINSIASLKAIIEEDGICKIGAACSYAQLDDYLGKKYEEFHFLFKRIAAQQVRNRGTIGGNICNASPIADLPPVLLVFDAELSGIDASGEDFSYALQDFYLDYKVTRLQEKALLCTIQFNSALLSHFFRFYKVSKRIEDDISTVLLALRFELQGEAIVDARIAYGGVAAVPLRVSTAEAAFKGLTLGDTTALSKAQDAVRQALTPLSDVRASAAYRSELACNLLEKAWMEACGTKLVSMDKPLPPEIHHA